MEPLSYLCVQSVNKKRKLNDFAEKKNFCIFKIKIKGKGK